MKNIVLLSDGTGNGAAKRHKTNVWRLYNALDLHHSHQIAMYDDGVGSQEFLLFKLLGGAFGWGLKRNVIELYKFLCRNYVAGDTGMPSDKIYLFGFSRGAFTVRVLAGLVDECGLWTTFSSESDLHEFAYRSYATYRKKYKGFRLSRLLAGIRDCLPGKRRVIKHRVVKPEINFIGVWDTVDAYGLPVDELAKLWDWFIFPLRFEDKKLSKKVLKACHAVSIDDERHTFHPVLWDESKQCTPGRIEQVWFPGVHSDVGGGYPRHDLALVSLDWMISKVEKRTANPFGLIFLPDLRAEYRRRSDWNGIQHDSRAGLRAFYRYRPRNIEALLAKAGAKGAKGVPPKIHRSAFERIRGRVVPYAPTGLPAKYDIVATRGVPPPFETAQEATARQSAMNRALDIVFWRRWLYRAFLATTLMLVASPVILDWKVDAPCTGVDCVLEPMCELAKGVLPDFAASWVAALCQNPIWLALLAFLYAAWSVVKRFATARTFERAAEAWSYVKKSKAPTAWKPTVTSWLRAVSAGITGHVMRCAWWCLFSTMILGAIVMAVDRTAFHIRDGMGWLCEPSNVPQFEPGERMVEFDTAEPCQPAGIELVAGTTYRFDLKDLSEWMDGDLPARPSGLVNAAPLVMRASIPFRRRPSRPWFELTGRIGQSGREVFAIGSGTCYSARSSGPLYLYVNDAVSGLMPDGLWAFPYFWSVGSNQGTVSIIVKPMGRSSSCGELGHCVSCDSR